MAQLCVQEHDIRRECFSFVCVGVGEAYANSADPDQTPHNATSDQTLDCLLTECSIKI